MSGRGGRAASATERRERARGYPDRTQAGRPGTNPPRREKSRRSSGRLPASEHRARADLDPHPQRHLPVADASRGRSDSCRALPKVRENRPRCRARTRSFGLSYVVEDLLPPPGRPDLSAGRGTSQESSKRIIPLHMQIGPLSGSRSPGGGHLHRSAAVLTRAVAAPMAVAPFRIACTCAHFLAALARSA